MTKSVQFHNLHLGVGAWLPRHPIFQCGFCKLLPEDGPEEFTAKFEAAIEGLDDFLVFADLLGGTPCNVVSRLIMEGRNVELYAGMNLPMVIEFINASLTGADADYKSRAAESIVKVNDLLAGFDDDEDE